MTYFLSRFFRKNAFFPFGKKISPHSSSQEYRKASKAQFRAQVIKPRGLYIRYFLKRNKIFKRAAFRAAREAFQQFIRPEGKKKTVSLLREVAAFH